MSLDGLVFARCSFCEDGFMAPEDDVRKHSHDGEWLCSVCRNIPAEAQAAIAGKGGTDDR